MHSPTGGRRDPFRDAYVLVAVAWCLAIAAGITPWDGVDARQFYDHRFPDPYAVGDYASGSGFYYSPPVALLLAPFTALPFGVFHALLAGTGFAALFALLGRWAWLGLLFPPVWWDLSGGNINTVLGAVAVFGLRSPALWSFALLTKVTPGIGVVWFAVRREWHHLGISLVSVAILCLVSALVAPSLWPAWIAALTSNDPAYVGPGFFVVAVPLLPRLVVAALLVVWGARTDRRWTVPIAVWLSIPVLWWSTAAALVAVAAVFPERRGERRPGPAGQ
jgi:hypothetical protein